MAAGRGRKRGGKGKGGGKRRRQKSFVSLTLREEARGKKGGGDPHARYYGVDLSERKKKRKKGEKKEEKRQKRRRCHPLVTYRKGESRRTKKTGCSVTMRLEEDSEIHVFHKERKKGRGKGRKKV